MEKKDTKTVTGIINNGSEKIGFYGEGFKFVFMKIDNWNEKTILKADENGYIWGRTCEEKVIAIYAQKDLFDIKIHNFYFHEDFFLNFDIT